MSKNIYIDSFGGNIIGALAEGTKLLEYIIEKESKVVTVGSVFKGTIQNILPGMNSAFVSIGLAKNGYLSASDMLMDKSEIIDKVDIPMSINGKVGDEIMVQAIKEPSGSKGVRLTSNISIASRNLVYLPNMDFIGISRKITDEKIKQKLQSLIMSIKPKGGGFILRTASCENKLSRIKSEAKFLINQYKLIQNNFKSAKPNTCIFEEGSIAVRMLRDVYTDDVDKFIVPTKEIQNTITNYAKQLNSPVKSKISLYNKNQDMFSYYGLSREVENLISGSVELSNGGYLIFDKTEAMTVIDVNTGKFVGKDNLSETVFETNMLASEEIAHQLRLRNISGIVLIDFIDMDTDEQREMVLEKLRQSTDDDRSKCVIHGMTRLGLCELTRKKKRKESSSMLKTKCPYCNGEGHIRSHDLIVSQIRSSLLDLFANDYNNAIIHLNVEIAEYILQKNKLKTDIEKFFNGKRIYIVPHKTYHQHFFITKGDNSYALDLPDNAVLLY